jgi:hypothetical protein
MEELQFRRKLSSFEMIERPLESSDLDVVESSTRLRSYEETSLLDRSDELVSRTKN